MKAETLSTCGDESKPVSVFGPGTGLLGTPIRGARAFAAQGDNITIDRGSKVAYDPSSGYSSTDFVINVPEGCGRKLSATRRLD